MDGGEMGGHYRGRNTTSKAPEVGVSMWSSREERDLTRGIKEERSWQTWWAMWDFESSTKHTD